jgi:hypothetical protein
MTPRPEAAPAAASDRAISHHQHQQQPDASRGHFKPSRRGQCKPSFSPCPALSPGRVLPAAFPGSLGIDVVRVAVSATRGVGGG